MAKSVLIVLEVADHDADRLAGLIAETLGELDGVTLCDVQTTPPGLRLRSVFVDDAESPLDMYR